MCMRPSPSSCRPEGWTAASHDPGHEGDTGLAARDRRPRGPIPEGRPCPRARARAALRAGRWPGGTDKAPDSMPPCRRGVWLACPRGRLCQARLGLRGRAVLSVSAGMEDLPFPRKTFPNSAREVGRASPTLACRFNAPTIAPLDCDQLLGHYHL